MNVVVPPAVGGQGPTRVMRGFLFMKDLRLSPQLVRADTIA
jgi:hypothetical protein